MGLVCIYYCGTKTLGVGVCVGKCEQAIILSKIPYHPVYSCSDTDLLPIRDHLGQTERHNRSKINFMQFIFWKIAST